MTTPLTTTTTTSPIVFKACLRDDIRRITVLLPDLAAVRAQLETLFGAALPANYHLVYEDSDGDMVRVTSDAELKEAVSLARNRTPPLLKLLVKDDVAPAVAGTVSSAPATPASNTPGAPMRHIRKFGCKAAARHNHSHPRHDHRHGYDVLYCGPDAGEAAAVAAAARAQDSNNNNADGSDGADPVVVAELRLPAAPAEATGTTGSTSEPTAATAAAAATATATTATAGGGCGGGGRWARHANTAERMVERAESLCDRVAVRGGSDDAARRAADKLSARVDKLRARLSEGRNMSDADAAHIAAQLTHSLTLLQNLPAAAGSRFTAPAVDAAVEHTGVTCDHCGMVPIVGVRFKCAECPDYDLCERCEAQAVHSDETGHVFLKVTTPRCLGMQRPLLAMQPRMSALVLAQQQLRARFINHETIHDRTEVACGTSFVKVWRMRNVGDLPWPAGTRLLFVGGDQLAAAKTTALQTLPAPGEETAIGVDMCAPDAPGKYQAFFRLATADGVRFGHRVWAEIIAVAAGASKVPPAADPAFFVGSEAPAPLLAAANSAAPVSATSGAPTTPTTPTTTPITPTTVPAPTTTPTTTAPVPLPVPLPAQAEAVPLARLMPSVPCTPPYVHARALQQLLDMGFGDADMLRTLLDANGGEVVQVVRLLLGR